jgi:hypothetical protein
VTGVEGVRGGETLEKRVTVREPVRVRKNGFNCVRCDGDGTS